MSKHPSKPSAHPKPDAVQNHGAQGKRDISGNIHVRGVVETHIPPSFVEKYEAASKNNEARETIREGRDQKRFSVEIFTALIVLIYTVLTYFQWHTANNSLQATRDQFAASERPWISLEITRAQLSITGNFITIDPSEAMLSNVGHSIAKNVVYAPVLVLGEEENGQECNRSLVKPKAAYPQGVVAFPGEKWIQYWSTGKDGPLTQAQKISLRLVGCVLYTSTLDNVVHHTRVVYFIDPQQKTTTPFANPGVYTLVLRKDINGNSAD